MNWFFRIIFTIFVYSGGFLLGVFGLQDGSYYVVEPDKNLCSIFIRGTSESPNWLPEGWISGDYTNKKEAFRGVASCRNSNIGKCCTDLGYRYAGSPVGQASISNERLAAEFLASKKYINSQSLAPSKYELAQTITRREVMKIIMNMSEKSTGSSCREIFRDVSSNDWGCPYIESALNYSYISDNDDFRPNDTLTQSEAIKLIFQARDISKRYDTDSWQQDYVSSAYYLGYIDEKLSYFNAPATRGWFFDVAARTYNEYSSY